MQLAVVVRNKSYKQPKMGSWAYIYLFNYLISEKMSSWIMPDQCICPRDCEFRKYSVDLNLGNFDAIPYLAKPMNV